MVPQVGQRIGPYEVLGRLGSGGMGLVFSAWDSRLQRDVALKILREEFATTGMRQRFLQEARAASRLNHANICTIFDIGEQDGDPYLVMELLKGDTIRARIARGAVSPEDIIAVATEVADALIVAHARGIIHRDIKPANIMLVDKPAGRFQTKVLDFGLAKVERGDGAETRFDLTSAGTTVGTVAYMSPEQARGEALDARSDLFSLGTVLYEMATGELPFQGATSALVFVQLLSQAPEPVREFNPDIPKDLERVILTLLEKKRNDRYQSAVEVVEALSRITLKRSSKGFWGVKQPAKSWGRDRTDDPPTLPARRPSNRSGVVDSFSGTSRIADQRSKPRSEAAAPILPSPAPEGKSLQDSTEMFLRPVKRVLPGDSSRPASGLSDPNVLAASRADTPRPDMPRPEASRPEAPRHDAPPPPSSPASGLSATNLQAAKQDPVRTSKPDVHPSAFSLFQAASTAAHRATGSSTEIKRAPQGSSTAIPTPNLTSGLHRPPARSSSGVLPIPTASPLAPPVGSPAPASPKPSSEVILPVEPAATSSSSISVPVETGPSGSGSHPSRIVSTRVVARKFTAPEVRYEDEEEDVSSKKGGRAVLIVFLLLVAAAIGFGVWYKMFRKALPLGSTPVSLLLVSLSNHTGDTTLDGVFQTGMLLDLEQSPHLSVRGRTDLLAGAHSVGVNLTKNVDPSTDDARRIAQIVGASTFAFGSIDASNGEYTVSLHIYDASTGNSLKDASETAASREQVPDAIDRISSDVRLGLGESGDAVSSGLVPLARDGSANPDALAAFAAAENLKAAGKLDDAAVAYERATTIDSHFTQAYIELADIRRQQHAEVEAAQAALKAQDNASNASLRTQKLAKAMYSLITQGDSAAAIATLQDLCATYTADTEAHVLLAMSQRLAGNYADALTTSQGVLAMAPYNSRARSNAEMAMIATNALADARQMEVRSAAMGMPHASIAALLSLLSPDGASQSEASQVQEVSAKISYASVLDAGGQFTAAMKNWQDVVAHAQTDATMTSSGSYALAHAALDHAMAADCPAAQSLLQAGVALPSGPEAQYFAGMAATLCGDQQAAKLSHSELVESAKQSRVAREAFLPTLTAALQWKGGDGTAAFNALHNQAPDGAIWLPPYLAGLIQLGLKNGASAQSAFDPIVNRNSSGGARVAYPELYALAQLQSARAFAANGDPRSSSDAYKAFADLWTNADAGNSLVVEAKSHIQ